MPEHHRGEDGWSRAEKLVLFRLDQISTILDRAVRDINKQGTDIRLLKLHAAIWGAVAGTIFGAIATALFGFALKLLAR